MENDTAHLEPAKVWLKLHETSRSTISRKDALTESERDLYEALTAKFTFDAKMLATVVDGTPCSVSFVLGAEAEGHRGHSARCRARTLKTRKTNKMKNDKENRKAGSELLAVLRSIGEALKDVPQIGEMDEEIDESDEDHFKLQDGWIDGNTEKWRPMTDDEVKEFYPVTWTRRKIAEILSANA